MSPPRTDAFDCPNCGADVPAKALACPECGSDDETGWSDDTAYDDLDLPEPGYGDDDETLTPGNGPAWKPAVYGLAAVVLLIAFFWMLTRGGRLW